MTSQTLNAPTAPVDAESEALAIIAENHGAHAIESLSNRALEIEGRFRDRAAALLSPAKPEWHSFHGFLLESGPRLRQRQTYLDRLAILCDLAGLPAAAHATAGELIRSAILEHRGQDGLVELRTAIDSARAKVVGRLATAEAAIAGATDRLGKAWIAPGTPTDQAIPDAHIGGATYRQDEFLGAIIPHLDARREARADLDVFTLAESSSEPVQGDPAFLATPASDDVIALTAEVLSEPSSNGTRRRTIARRATPSTTTAGLS